MKLRRGQLWQRLGLAILSGILVATLAPSTAAAPTDGHETHSDAESADLEIEGDLEDRIAAVVGHVDMLKAGHHGRAPPVDVRLVEELVRQLVLLCGSPLLCDEPVGERSRHLVLDGFHRRYGDRMDLRRKLPILPRRQGESDRSGVAERRRELALFRRRSCVNRMARRPRDLVSPGRVNRCHGHRYAGY